jgi:hypothetical protein
MTRRKIVARRLLEYATREPGVKKRLINTESDLCMQDSAMTYNVASPKPVLLSNGIEIPRKENWEEDITWLYV